jgi:hypothetical protein
MSSPEIVREALDQYGFAVVRSVSPGGVIGLTAALGEVICVSQVRLDPAVGSYLASPEPIPPHTDHPDARYIAWICRESDHAVGDNLLVDGHAIVDALPGSARRSLAAARLECPQLDGVARAGRFGRQPMRPHPVWDGKKRALFFAPWLPRSAKDDESLAHFVQLVERAPRNRVRLETGDVLVVANYRILHARDALPRESRRWLTRYWIKAAD